VGSVPGRLPRDLELLLLTSFSLDSLTAGTLYHIVVSATDHEGRTAYRVGTFKTVAPPPLPPAIEHEQRPSVWVTLWKIEILNDADHDCCVWANKGEIRFDHFVNGTRRHLNGEAKRATGSSFQPQHPLAPIFVENAPRYLALRIVGRERDRGAPTGFDSSGPDFLSCHSYDTGTQSWDVSCAHKALDLENLHDDVDGGDYGGMPFGHDAYVVFESPSETTSSSASTPTSTSCPPKRSTVLAGNRTNQL